jgi:hypothetical protein
MINGKQAGAGNGASLLLDFVRRVYSFADYRARIVTPFSFVLSNPKARCFVASGFFSADDFC